MSMNKMSIIQWGTVGALLTLLFSSCLNMNGYQPMEVQRYHMGSAMINDKPYEHVVYFSQYGSLDNPFLRSNRMDNMVLFPILLSPAGGDQKTDVAYTILLCIDAKEGIPVLNKPYTIVRNSLLDKARNSDEIMRLFISQRSKLLTEGAEGIAVVYDYANRLRVSASGTVTFTSFDMVLKNCSGTYTFNTEEPKDKVLVFKNGTIATRIARDNRML